MSYNLQKEKKHSNEHNKILKEVYGGINSLVYLLSSLFLFVLSIIIVVVDVGGTTRVI